MKTTNRKLVGIVSYNIYSKHMNYGAALHSYAFQQFLMKMGIKSIIISYKPKELENYYLKYPILNIRRTKTIKYGISILINWGLGFFSNLRKYRKFQHFFNEHTYKTKKMYNYESLKNLSSIENYDFTDFVAESDVIWKKTNKNGEFDDCFF